MSWEATVLREQVLLLAWAAKFWKRGAKKIRRERDEALLDLDRAMNQIASLSDERWGLRGKVSELESKTAALEIQNRVMRLMVEDKPK